MRTASQLFYLAFFTFLHSSQTREVSTPRSRGVSSDVCAVSDSTCIPHRSLTVSKINPETIVSDACASYETLNSLNRQLSPSLKTITQSTDFFGYYRLNLFNRVCPFWNDANSMCGNIACAVNTLEDEKDIPEIWRVEQLSRLEGPKAKHPGRKQQKERGSQRPLQGDLGHDVGETCVVEYDDECDERDYCVPEDESAAAKGDYVSLLDNPERFTGYAGESAHLVWDTIYKENCFSKPSPPAQDPFNFYQAKASIDLRSVLQANAPSTAFAPDDSCMEKRVFYRVISGMHASISTHICHDYLNQTTGTWGPNLECYKDRLAAHPDRISNLYFNYALVLRAVAKLQSHLESYTFCSGDPQQDLDTKSKVLRLVNAASSVPPIFDESLMFSDPAVAGDLKEDFRQRFRNVSRLMDCVGCDKCRLWGKLQTVGYGTALKVLFEFDEAGGQDQVLKRTELVALMNTLDRISSSLSAIESFNGMLSEPALSPKQQNVTPQPVSISAKPVADLLDDVDDDYDYPELYESQYQYPDIKEATMEEFELIFRTLRWVLRSWLDLPRKALGITIFELSRAWSFWLGLEVQQREYGFKIPTKEEL